MVEDGHILLFSVRNVMLRFTKLIAFGKEIELEESEERVPE